MKLLSRFMAMLALAFVAVVGAADLGNAQTYPFQTPTYIPSAVLPTTTFTATGDYYFNANGVAGASVRMSGLSGTLVAAIQGSNDPLGTANASATWTTLYYLDASNPATAPANSITANGLYVFNTSGFTRFRVHITTLTSSSHTVIVQAAVSVGPNVVYVGNPGAAQALPTGAATSALQTSNGATAHTDAAAINTTLGSPFQAGGSVGSLSDYPTGAIPETASATGTTAATTATLATAVGKTTYICGYSISTSANAATVVNDTVTGTITGTLNFSNYVPVNTAGVGTDKQSFSRCIPASTTNTAIAVVSGAAGTGGVTSVSAWGYQL